MTVTLAGYDFDDRKICFVCNHVYLGKPVLAFVHDNDGDLMAVCGGGHRDDGDFVTGNLGQITAEHPELLTLPRVDRNEMAERLSPKDPWLVKPFEPD